MDLVSIPASRVLLTNPVPRGIIDQSYPKRHYFHQSFPGNDDRISVLHQDSGGFWKSIPSALEIFLTRGFWTPWPSGFPSGLGVQNPRPRKISQISLDPRNFLGLGKFGGGDGLRMKKIPNDIQFLVLLKSFNDSLWSMCTVKAYISHILTIFAFR